MDSHIALEVGRELGSAISNGEGGSLGIVHRNTWTIRVCGGFRLFQGTRSVTHYLPPRARALVALVVLHPDGVSNKHELAMTLWPDVRESQARTNVRNVMFQIHRTLPALSARIVSTRSVIALEPGDDLEVDIWRYEMAGAAARRATVPICPVLRADLEEAALRLGDPVMPECYEDWVLDPRGRAAALRSEILTRLIEAAQAEGNQNAVIRYARWGLDVAPT